MSAGIFVPGDITHSSYIYTSVEHIKHPILRFGLNMRLFSLICTLLFSLLCKLPDAQQVSEEDKECGLKSCNCCMNTFRCNSIGHCFVICKEGYHGLDCRYICPSTCVICHSLLENTSIANCTTCKDGFYNTEEDFQCQSLCPNGCKTCISQSNCTSCNTGYVSDPQNPGKCLPCLEHCGNCSTPDTCLSCKEGYFSNDIDGLKAKCERCPPNCKSCSSPINCTECFEGRYGETCKASCSNGCLKGTCDIATGHCTCRHMFRGDKCEKCTPGYHGKECSERCKGFACDMYGCDRDSAACFACYSNEVYGDHCDKECPRHCKARICKRGTGNCILGCIDGYSGDKCCLNALNCKQCSSFDVCQSCIKGKYGPFCDRNCSETCRDGVCTFADGRCLECEQGFYGHMCNATMETNGEPTYVEIGAVAGMVAVLIIIVFIIVRIICRIRMLNAKRTISPETAKQYKFKHGSQAIEMQATYENITEQSAEKNIYMNVY